MTDNKQTEPETIQDVSLYTPDQFKQLVSIINENSDLLPRAADIIQKLLTQIVKSNNMDISPELGEEIKVWKLDLFQMKVKTGIFNSGESMN